MNQLFFIFSLDNGIAWFCLRTLTVHCSQFGQETVLETQISFFKVINTEILYFLWTYQEFNFLGNKNKSKIVHYLNKIGTKKKAIVWN